MFANLFGPKLHPKVPKPLFSELAKRCRFDEGDLKKLFRRFLTMCDAEDGLVREKALFGLEEFVINPLLMWFVSFEVEQSPQKGLNFDALVRILSVMSPDEEAGVKIAYLLRTLREMSRIDINEPESETAATKDSVHAENDASVEKDPPIGYGDNNKNNLNNNLNNKPPPPLAHPPAPPPRPSAAISRQLFMDLFVHLNSGLAPAEEVKILAQDVWSSFGIAKDGAVWEAGPIADRAFVQFVSQYDLWNLLTAEIVF